MDALMAQQFRAASETRWDVWAFATAFGLGLAYYASFRLILPDFGWSPSRTQLALTIGILLVMVGYAVCVASVSRLRLRLDQAGDNGYYLGLLFTLISMAFALWEFGQAAATSSGGAAASLGARQIISNFGIALASTIAGIAIRIVLHQMRVDPAEVEGMTRIELAEASKRVRATLDNISLEMGQFHGELQQRSSDAVSALLQELASGNQKIVEDLKHSAEVMFKSIQAGHNTILEQTAQLTSSLTNVANEAIAASERLRQVEPPSTTFTRRLGQMTEKLEAVTESVGLFGEDISSVTSAASGAAEKMTTVAQRLEAIVGRIEQASVANEKRVSNVTEKVNQALGDIGNRLEADSALFERLQSQLRNSAEQTVKVQVEIVSVLTSMAEAARRISGVVRNVNVGDGKSSSQ
jgi:predicted  nucleic acid-binding Zn-ribbon protein